MLGWGINLAKKYVWVAVVMAGVFGTMLALTPASDRAQMGATFGLLAALITALQAPPIRQFILRHRRGAIAVGIGAVGITPLVFFSGLSPLSFDPQVVGTATAFLTMVGSLVIFLPFMARRLERDVAALKADGWKAAAQRAPGAFSPGNEVKAVLAELSDHRGALLRVVGPWFFLFCVLPVLFMNVGYSKEFADRDRGFALMILLVLLILLLTELALLSVAMIQWARFTATRREPRLTAFPAKALWGWAWRWFICGVLFRSLDRIEPWLKAHLATATQWQLDGLLGLIGFIMLVFFSPFALVLPAVALDAADKGIVASMRGFRLVGRKYYLGAAMILAPYALATWGLGVAYDHYKGPVAAVANVGASVILLFITMIVGMTYLTRIYLRGSTTDASAI